jgi:hypothetical protein
MATVTRLAIAFLLGVEVVAAQQLELSLDGVKDISGVGFFGVGGASFDDRTDHLWICGSGFLSDKIVELDPITGQVLFRFDGSVVPGLTFPTALAMQPMHGTLYLFAELQAAGEVTQAGVLVKEIDADHVTAAATDPDGELFVFSDLASGGDGAIHQVDQATGLFQTTIPIDGYSGAVSSMAPCVRVVVASTDPSPERARRLRRGEPRGAEPLAELKRSAAFRGAAAPREEGVRGRRLVSCGERLRAATQTKPSSPRPSRVALRISIPRVGGGGDR